MFAQVWRHPGRAERCSRAYVLMRGSVVLEGNPKTLAASPQLKDAYLGMASGPLHPDPDLSR
jgi:hypothetical protein